MKKILISALIILTGATTILAQNQKAEELYQAARELIRSKQWTAGAKTINEALQLNITPDFRAKYLTMCGTLYRDSIGDQQTARNYFTKADALYDEIISMKTDSLNVSLIFSELALAAYADSAKQYDITLNHYSKALNLVHHITDNRIRAIEFNGTDLLMMYNTIRLGRAFTYARAKDFENAEISYDESYADFRSLQLSDDPELVAMGYSFGLMTAQGKLSMCLYDKKDIICATATCRDMQKLINEALNSPVKEAGEGISVNVPFYLTTMAEAFLEAKELINAATCCDRALEWPNAESFRPLALHLRGEVYLAQGNEAEARRCYEEVKQLVSFFYEGDYAKSPLNQKFGK